MGESVVSRLELEGYSVTWCRSAEEARLTLDGRDHGLVISDIRLPGMNGDALFTELRRESATLPPFIFVTGFGDLESAVELLKAGAVDYVTKPFDMDRLLTRVADLLPARSAEPSAVLGISAAMRDIESMVRRVAALDTPVLITGETGTGKEVIARFIHAGSPRAAFFAVNCAALAESLVESELFGHDKGAFTGAAKAHRGVFERARGGSLFLDEIGDMPLSMQARLLRVLQDRTITRVGGEQEIGVDVRLLCATHKNLDADANEGCFRPDLLYRINVVHLHVPPLRERAEDILWLARGFLEEAAERLGRALQHLTPDAEQALLEYRWPGNVRELRHRLERASIFSDTPAIEPVQLFPDHKARGFPSRGAQDVQLREYLRGCEKRFIEHCLLGCDGRIGETAKRLGISRKALWEKMRRLGIESSAP